MQSAWDAMENVGQVKAGFELITLPFPPNAFHWASRNLQACESYLYKEHFLEGISHA